MTAWLHGKGLCIHSVSSSLISRREYPEQKLQENLDSEIMEVLLQEARDSYDEEIVVELTSNNSDEMESNIGRIETWVKQWRKDNKSENWKNVLNRNTGRSTHESLMTPAVTNL